MAWLTYDGLIEMLTNQQANLPTHGAAVGATAAEIQSVSDDLANLVYMRNYQEVTDTKKKTVTAGKQTLFTGDKDDPPFVFPVFAGGTWPETFEPGCLPRAQGRNARWKTAAGINDAARTALDLDDDTTPTNPQLVKPTFEAFPAQTGGMFAVVVANRGESKMWNVRTAPVNTSNWTISKSAEGKATNVTIPIGDSPIQLLVQIQLLKNDEPYGQLSDIVLVTVNP